MQMAAGSTVLLLTVLATSSGALVSAGASNYPTGSIPVTKLHYNPTTTPGGTAPNSNGVQSGDKLVSPPKSGYVVYWDQNEEEDYYESANGSEGQLETPWDPNGQMCIVPHTNGDWVVGYDPTNPSQHNPGGPPDHPFHQPGDGEELNNHYGVWTGTDLYVPGPYKTTQVKGAPGQDTPKTKGGQWNGNSTYTGCDALPNGNVVADDIATAQGTFPVPHDGRLVEWFAPKYTSYCILTGPTSGGYGPHHADGTGGLAQPGMMTSASNGDLLVPEARTSSSTATGPGVVLRVAHTSLPTSAGQCPGGVYPQGHLHVTDFMKGTSTFMSLPSGVAQDPKCGCIAVDQYIGSPAVAFYSETGKLLSTRPTIPGEKSVTTPDGFNPFGMAFAPDGSLYFVDIHISCASGGLSGCGPTNNEGRVLEVPFSSTGQAQLPPKVIATGFDFPTSATICVIGHGVCPFPAYKTPKPSVGTKAEAG
jgi:hypothetical protein